ncbi:MAG: autotransporter-associated beta strand repeat-containing protein, partial [Verrucomicrobiota bacterium]|nr:autotransporter-associated beta strand repeat-containing protein [Verrucomicrobiota bacterium]
TNDLNTTFSGVIQGNGGAITKTGSGTFTLSGSNSYTGATNIMSGKLVVSNATGSATGSGPVTIALGATLTGNGTIDGNLTIDSGGTAEIDGGVIRLNGENTNNGLCILKRGAQISGGPSSSFTNNGLLDVITGGTFTPPPSFVNNGTIVDSSVVRARSIAKTGTTLTITLNGYTGHTYRLQKSSSPSGFTDVVGSDQQGSTGTALTFSDTNAVGPESFLRVIVDP